jgi:putative hydroxymethylpyrimidine transport system substrate-binding protein
MARQSALIIFFILLAFNSSAKISLLLDWYVNPNHAPLIIADKKGFFKQQGLQVSITAPTDAHTPAKLVAVGKADLAISYQYHLYLHHKAGLPLIRVGTLIETPLNALAVKRDGPIKTLKDLKGKKIGCSMGLGTSRAFINTLLKHEGMSENDVEFIHAQQSLSTGFLSGGLDAITGAYRNVEPFIYESKGVPIRLFYYEEAGVPLYDELILVANKNKLDRSQLKKFIHALEQGTHYLINHPDECWEIFVQHYPEMNTKLNKQSWHATLPRFAMRPGALDEERYRKFGAYLREYKLIDVAPKVHDIAIDVRN